MGKAQNINWLKNGDENGFRQFFEDSYRPLVSFALKETGNLDEAEELVQDNLARLWEKREEIELSTGLLSYCFRMIRNAVINQGKHEQVKRKYESEFIHTNSEIDMPDNNFEEELHTRLQESINSLPEKCREVFKLSRFEGLKYQEIAEKLNISVKTVENQMSKALRTIREDMNKIRSLNLFLLQNLFILLIGVFHAQNVIKEKC